MDYLPENHATADCPHCKGKKCAFSVPSHNSGIRQEITYTFNDDLGGVQIHSFGVSYCNSCGQPLIGHILVDRGAKDLKVYPISPARPPAPALIDQLAKEVAQEYNEAVGCEPLSKQAAVVLLSRCASLMLISKCAADKDESLGVQFQSAFKDDKLKELKDQASDLKDVRNLVGHAWLDQAGNVIRATQDQADWWFDVVDLMFEELYIGPVRIEERRERVRSQKASRDKSASQP